MERTVSCDSRNEMLLEYLEFTLATVKRIRPVTEHALFACIVRTVRKSEDAYATATEFRELLLKRTRWTSVGEYRAARDEAIQKRSYWKDFGSSTDAMLLVELDETIELVELMTK